MNFLDETFSLEKLKSLSVKELEDLAEEIRSFLVHSVSKTGGHLASNLGVVELTIALHYCFDSPKDQILWDVGHQSYVHKILTGRTKGFETLRKYKGLSGFPKPAESPHDIFAVGHSSSSISAGYGLCVSRDLLKKTNHVISVIGDGSMTGGMAFEALNNAGRSETNFIVVLNDNQWSIAQNVGAFATYLNNIRTAPGYVGAKAGVSKFLRKIPLLGSVITAFIDWFKSVLRYILVPGVFFEELGFKYIGPIDGHDLNELTKVFNKVKRMKGPLLLHVYTKKGKGYEQAEASPAVYHGVSSFDVETGEPISHGSSESFSSVFGSTLAELAESNHKILAVTASMPDGTGLGIFQKKFPRRFFDVGIAEAHAVTFCAGLAKNGFVPVFAVYSTFLQRAYDQVLQDVCLQGLPVVLAVDRASVGSDGETHQGIYDIAFLSHMPNLTILAPMNFRELSDMLAFSANHGGPVAIRYPRGCREISENFDSPIIFSKSQWLAEGDGVAIISVGAMMKTAHEVFLRLKKICNPALINARFIKPMDEELVEALWRFKRVYVIEDGVLNGGYGSNLGLLLKNPQTLKIFSFPDVFVPQGSEDELYIQYGLDAESIYNAIAEDVSCDNSRNSPES